MSLEAIQERLSSVLNYDELLTRCLNRIDFVERMLALFHERCVEDLVELEQAFEKADTDSIRRVSHRLAGASANAAAFGVQRCAAELRCAATNGKFEDVRDRLEDLRQEWRRFTSAIAVEQPDSSSFPSLQRN